MQNRNIAQVKAIERKNKERLLKVNPNLKDVCGIYFLTRGSEEGLNYFYIGQASKSVLGRLAQHLSGYQHIDLSIKKRGFYSADNPYGWKIGFKEYPKEELDKWEQHWILEYQKHGYQCRYNKTGGGQGTGKEKINEYLPQKGYHDGLAQGRKNLAKELLHIIDLHLTVKLKEGKESNKVSQKALDKFWDLLKGSDGE